MRRKVNETETLKHERGNEASKKSGGSHAPQPIAKLTTPRHNVGENRGASLSGDIKERLQVKPEEGARKKPAGDHWVPFVSADRMGEVMSDDATCNRSLLSLNKYDQTPSMDNDQALQDAYSQDLLACSGFRQKGVLKERGTDDSNEYLYEEVKDKESGDTGLLYRNNYFDRI